MMSPPVHPSTGGPIGGPFSPGFFGAGNGANHIGTPGGVGFGVGVCPVVPTGFIELPGTRILGHDNYGNYQYADGSIMCWVPAFYYRIAHTSNPTYAAYGVNSIDVRPEWFFANVAAANAAGYALHRAFIDGGEVKRGFMVDKYLCSKKALGSGYIGSSIKGGLPISSSSSHNPVLDLTAASANAIYSMVDCAHARDGVDGAVNPASIFFPTSRFIYAALALLATAHGQAAASPANCAWYDAAGITNFPKGCNNNALSDVNDTSVKWESDGYSNCGKTGSAGYSGGAGNLFAKAAHNGQNCGVADLNGLMWEISTGISSIISGGIGIEGITSAATPVFTKTVHGLSAGDVTQIDGITQADWIVFKDKLWTVATVPTADTFTLASAPDTTGYAAYDAGTDPGTYRKGTVYVAKEDVAMRVFTGGNTGATDHWGATGIAAMMDAFSPAFETNYPNNGYAQRYGEGAGQVLSGATSGAGRLSTGLGCPGSSSGISASGTNLFGTDYYYQYLVSDLCLLSGASWGSGAGAGVWAAYWVNYRTNSSYAVGFRLACYLV